ncbi:MAG TPA: cyclic nucleotide-binding domain-containing protein [Anaerolineales bacterium]|nr:cyclic nucleotide-binding domain-containing protein [Anaerolineales bacterium]
MNQIAIFKGLDAEKLELLRPLFERFSCLAGTVIFQQGDPADFLYLVINGNVEISFQPYDGVPILIAHVEKDDLFGWSAVVGSDKYTSSAIANEDVEALRLRSNRLRRFCREHPEAGRELLDRLANRVSLRRTDAHRQVESMLVQGILEKS